MSEWISWQRLHELPYNKADFELLDLIPKGLYPFDSLTKQPIPCPDYCHNYHQRWRHAGEEELTEEEHEEIKRTFAKITDDDPNATSWKYFVLPSIEEDVRNVILLLEKAIFTRADVDKVYPARQQPRPEPTVARLGEAQVRRARELRPIVERLYDLTMKEHRPLKAFDAIDCLETALSILDDNPEDYSPINKDDLTLELFTMHPSHSRRDFVGRLLQRLVKHEHGIAPAYQKLYKATGRDT